MKYSLLVEGGGTRTWGGCYAGHWLVQRRIGSINQHSIDERTARDRYAALIRELVASIGDKECENVVVAHGGASSAYAAAVMLDQTVDCLRECGITAAVLVANDILPLLALPETDDVVAIIAGTGTGFAARRRWHRWSRAGGLEYLLSDEGGGFDIGLAGLRSVVRADDGRGRATSLTARAMRWAGRPAMDLRGTLFAMTYTSEHKRVVADFAREVDAAAAAGDQVAGEIISSAVAQLNAGAAAVARRSACRPSRLTVVFGGTLLTGGGSLAAAAASVITEKLRPARTQFVGAEQIPDAMVRLAQVAWAAPQWLDDAKQAIPLAWSTGV